MPMLQRIWRLCIVLAILAILAVRALDAVKVSTEEPFTQYKGSDDKYDLVDVAQQQGEAGSRSETGHTSRFYTTGDVDDEFWLKHLGEDFKRAIHLQVGGSEQYNGIYNMSEDGSAYKVQHEYTQKQHPVQANYESNQSTPPNSYSTEPEPIYSTTRKSLTEENKQQLKENAYQKENSYRNEQTYRKPNGEQSPANASDSHKYEQSFERVFALDDAGFANSIYNAKRKSHKYAKVQQINMKYTAKPTYTHKDPAAKMAKSQKNKALDKTLDTPPVVVNLPDNGKSVVQLEENDTPVVVKMPPVIYHADSETQTQSPQQEVEQQQTQQQQQRAPEQPTRASPQTYTYPQPTQVHAYAQPEPAQTTHTHTHTHYTEYPQPQHTAHTREHQMPQEHPTHDQFQFTPNQQHQQHEHHYELPTQQHEHQQHQHEHQQHQHNTHYQQYTTPNFYQPNPFEKIEQQSGYNKQNTYQSNDINTEDATHGLRYIFPSKQSPIYREDQQEQAESNYPDYNRVSRSNRDLFDQGL